MFSFETTASHHIKSALHGIDQLRGVGKDAIKSYVWVRKICLKDIIAEIRQGEQ